MTAKLRHIKPIVVGADQESVMVQDFRDGSEVALKNIYHKLFRPLCYFANQIIRTKNRQRYCC